MAKASQLAFGVLLSMGLGTLGCRERNPAYVLRISLGDGAIPMDAGLPLDAGMPWDAGIPNDVGFDVGWDGGLLASDAQVTIDEAASFDRGADFLQLDVLIPSLDANDATAKSDSQECVHGTSQSCLSVGNPKIGICAAGTQLCADGTWGACVGETLPQTETCNGLDDDCDGVVDNGLAGTIVCGMGAKANTVPFCSGGQIGICRTPASTTTAIDDGCPANGVDEDGDGLQDEDCESLCIWVSPNGSDNRGTGTRWNPYRTIPRGIGHAVGDPSGRQRICAVADSWNSNRCQPTDYSLSGSTPLSIPDGISLYGNYASTEGTACDNLVTRMVLSANQGILFDGTGSKGSALARFELRRASTTSSVTPTGTYAAVTVAGNRKVTLSHLTADDSPSGERTYGLHVTGSGAEVQLQRSRMGGGLGLVAIGVYVQGGTLALQSNCDTVNEFGRCATPCEDASRVLGIWGRNSGGPATPAGVKSHGAFIEGSAGTIAEANTICGVGPGYSAPNTAAVGMGCANGGCLHLAGNFITGGQASDAVGLSLVNASPAVEANVISGGCGGVRTVGVLLERSHARIQSNNIFSARCLTGHSQRSIGLAVTTSESGRGPEVYANDIDGGENVGGCESAGIELTQWAAGPRLVSGWYTNNIIGAGACSTRIAFSAKGDVYPRVLWNNDLYSRVAGVGAVLWQMQSQALFSIGEVNAQSAFAMNNISADPGYVGFPSNLQLSSVSPCIDQGTAVGAPLLDANRVARPQGARVDIGAYEFRGL